VTVTGPTAQSVATDGVPPGPLGKLDYVLADRLPGSVRVLTRKTVDVADRYQRAHFPGIPVFPGVFVIEALVQAVGATLARPDGRRPDVASIKSLRLSAPVLGDDAMTMEIVVEGASDAPSFEASAECTRGDGTRTARLVALFRWEPGGD
jgi:3-hydroxyacyl-[acyl-carrier-protein] dehydratase